MERVRKDTIKRLNTQTFFLTVACSLVLPFGASAQTISPNDPGFHDLTGTCSGVTLVGAHGVSADGSVVVGEFTHHDLFSDSDDAFIWTKQTGFNDLGPVHGAAQADAISPDGTIVAGTYLADGNNGASIPGVFLWTSSTGVQDLGPINTSVTYPQITVIGVSNNGDVIGNFISTVNQGDNSDGFVWPKGGNIIDLGLHIMPTVISPDGTLVLGNVDDPSSSFNLFKWTSTGGVVEFHGTSTIVMGISNQATTMVGSTLNKNLESNNNGVLFVPSYFLFRDVNSDVKKIASVPANSPLIVEAVSLDGSTIVGDYIDSSNCIHAFYYSLTTDAKN